MKLAAEEQFRTFNQQAKGLSYINHYPNKKKEIGCGTVFLIIFIVIPLITFLAYDYVQSSSRAKAKATLTQYIEETYGNIHNLYIYKADYYDAPTDYIDMRFMKKYPIYLCKVRDEFIGDIDFAVGLHENTIYDSYETDVGALRNTRIRINSDLRSHIEHTLFRTHQTNATSFGGYYIYDFDTIHDYMYLDMPFDANLPYKVEIFIFTPYESYGNDLSAFAVDIEQWHRMALAADMDIEYYRIVDDVTNNWDAAYILTPYEIENEDIIKLLADKSKDKS